MQVITMPPSDGLETPTGCVEFGETIQIQFDDNGYFACSNGRVFEPGLPAGNFPAGTQLGPYRAARHTTVDLVFIDTDKDQLFVLHLTIQTTCSAQSPE